MDHLDLRGGDLDIDLESGGTTSEEDGSEHQNSSGRKSKERLHRVWNQFVGKELPDASVADEQSFCSLGNPMNSDEIYVKSKERLPETSLGDLANSNEKSNAQVKSKVPKSKWPPKPPRPPGGPSLEPADLKLIKEISELAILKRKRTERRKALLKTRKQKTSSSSSNLLALLVTAVFFFVIIFQGLLGSRV